MVKPKTSLSVNINKIATLRNARQGKEPDLVEAAKRIQEFGAHGITVHPRPDERHIKLKDVYDLKKIVFKEFNIEGYPSDAFIRLINEVQPEQVTLVPDPPEAVTSSEGWDVIKNRTLLTKVLSQINGPRISVFIDPKTSSEGDFIILNQMGCHRIELYTEAFAKAFDDQKNLELTLKSYLNTAKWAVESGLMVNAGHDLNQANLGLFIKEVPYISEVSIGHALISESLYEGLGLTVSKYLKILEP